MASITSKGSLLRVWNICFQHVLFQGAIFSWCLCHCC